MYDIIFVLVIADLFNATTLFTSATGLFLMTCIGLPSSFEGHAICL